MIAAVESLTVPPLARARALRGGGTVADGDRVAREPGRRAAGPGAAGWRAVLEARWRSRLERVTELSLAFHDAAATEPGMPPSQPGPAARKLMRQAVAARQDLADTDEALARLAAGQYGRCESCSAPMSAGALEAAPEARYCLRCADLPA